MDHHIFVVVVLKAIRTLMFSVFLCFDMYAFYSESLKEPMDFFVNWNWRQLKRWDRLYSIESCTLRWVTHFETWNFFKFSPSFVECFHIIILVLCSTTRSQSKSQRGALIGQERSPHTQHWFLNSACCSLTLVIIQSWYCSWFYNIIIFSSS